MVKTKIIPLTIKESAIERRERRFIFLLVWSKEQGRAYIFTMKAILSVRTILPL